MITVFESPFTNSLPASRFIFFIPALLDMTATTTMYIGLTMTYASSFQMLRGALIVFTGILTITVLKRKLKSFQWLGIFIIISGLAVVGSNDFMKNQDESGEVGTGSMITGDILIILAQILTALQMIVEEKFLRGERRFGDQSLWRSVAPRLPRTSLANFASKLPLNEPF